MMLKKSNGFSLVEMLVGLVVLAIVMSMLLELHTFISKGQTSLIRKIDVTIDTSSAERIIFKDFNLLDATYNNIDVLDDNGLKFFDFLPDAPGTVVSNVSRILTLKAGTSKSEVIFLVQDRFAEPVLIYDPPAAYDIGDAPSDFKIPATLKFNSLNKNNWISTQRPGFWVNGKILMLDTSGRYRPLTTNGVVDLSVAPRSPIFLGVVQNSDLRSNQLISSIVNTKHPESGVVIDSADAFLRTIPAMGGGIPLVRIKSIKILKYSLVAYNDKRFKTQPAYLYKSIYENGAWSQPFLIADKVDSLVLFRDSILKRMIQFKLKLLE